MRIRVSKVNIGTPEKAMAFGGVPVLQWAQTVIKFCPQI